MILIWLLIWAIENTPHVIVLPVDHMNTWGLTLILAILLA